MKILHVCLAAFYIDNYSYQENMLPKYHKKLGYEVSILASLQTFDKNGNASFFEEESEYLNEYGIHVKRIGYKKIIKPLVRKLKIYKNLYENIKKENPDVIFIHGCQFFNMKDIVKYIKENPNTKVFVDNHCDFSNSATNWFSKNILHKILWRNSAKIIEPYTTRFYGVLPARVDFIIDMYNINPNKVKLLVMGADDDKVYEAKQKGVKERIRKTHGIDEDDFLIMTGGKIDKHKKQVLLLMKAIKNINNPKIKLIVFGSVTEDLQEELRSLEYKNIVKYIGWIEAENSYKYFASSDLVVFPGRHSVFWEQVAGLGIPMVVKYWEGTDHINVDNNCKFLYKDETKEIQSVIENIINDSNIYESMKKSANGKVAQQFYYSNISKESISL